MEYEVGQEVEIVIGQFTKMGMTVLIEEEHEGLLYKNEVYQRLEEGQRLKAYIKKVREDGKIDVSLQPLGFRNTIDANQQKVLQALQHNLGFLGLHDKSNPEDIKYELGMSKKAFKSAIGGLYKAKKITIEEGGIRLTTQQEDLNRKFGRKK